MKTRVISTEIWDEDKVFCLNIDTKLLYLILLTNPYIGQTRFYKINDRQLSTFSGLNVDQVKKCKQDLEDSKMAIFKDGYVCITGYGFIECFYKGSRNEKAKELEIQKIPTEVLSYFKDKLDTLSIPYTYPIDTTINNKSRILNHKSETINTKNTQIAEVIKAFEMVDPKNKTYYGNKTQRQASEFLIDEYGFSETLEMISLLPSANTMKIYIGQITNPYELKEKWMKLKNKYEELKGEAIKNKSNVAF